MLLLVSVYSAIIWVSRIRKRVAICILKTYKTEWICFLFFVIWSVCGIIWLLFGNTNAYAPTEIMGIISICMFAFCMFSLVETKEDIDFLLKIVILFGLVLTVIAIIEIVIGNFVPNTRYFYTLEDRIELGKILFPPTTVFYNENDYAAFILLCISIVCYWIIQAQRKRDFWYAIMIGLFLAIPTVLIDSTIFNLMSSFLVIITACSLLVIHRETMRSRIAKALILLSIAAVFMFGISHVIRTTAVYLNKIYFSEKIIDYYTPKDEADSKNHVGHSITFGNEITTDSSPNSASSMSESTNHNIDSVYIPDLSGDAASTSLANQIEAAKSGYGTICIRMNLIRAGWTLFLKHPILGYGPRAYQYEIVKHEALLDKTNGIVNPHFFYIEMLSQYGAVLFVMYMAIVMYVIVRSAVDTIKDLRLGKSSRGILCIFMLAAFSVSAIMPSTMINLTSLWLFFLLAVSAFEKMRPQNEIV